MRYWDHDLKEWRTVPAQKIEGDAMAKETETKAPTCCGREVTTPFCPRCGSKQSSGLAGLLAYCRAQRLKRSKKLHRAKEHSPTSDRLPKLEENAAKWLAWERLIEETIAQESEAEELEAPR